MFCVGFLSAVCLQCFALSIQPLLYQIGPESVGTIRWTIWDQLPSLIWVSSPCKHISSLSFVHASGQQRSSELLSGERINKRVMPAEPKLYIRDWRKKCIKREGMSSQMNHQGIMSASLIAIQPYSHIKQTANAPNALILFLLRRRWLVLIICPWGNLCSPDAQFCLTAHKVSVLGLDWYYAGFDAIRWKWLWTVKPSVFCRSLRAYQLSLTDKQSLCLGSQIVA